MLDECICALKLVRLVERLQPATDAGEGGETDLAAL
jgi:hypothetical protein